MNIGNNLGNALVMSDLGGNGVGELQNSANGVTGGSQSSVFQTMILQMLANNPALGENVNGGTQGQTKGMNDVLAKLLSGINPSNATLQNSGGELTELAKSIGKSEQSAMTDDLGSQMEAMQALQALMLGLTNPVPALNNENALSQLQNGKGNSAAPVSLIDAAQTIADNQKIAYGNGLGILGMNRFGINSQVQNDGSEQIKTQSEGKINIGENTAAAAGTDLLGAMNSEKVGLKDGQADEISILGAKPTDVTNNNQIADPTGKSEDAFKAVLDRKNKDAEAADNSQIGTDYSNQLQSAGLTKDTAELSSPVPTVEKTEPFSQIKDEILTKLEQKGPTEFKMQLDPEDLGQIDVKLRLSEGKLMIDILAANSKTQALLTSQVDKLISSMGLQNVQVESVQVGQQMNSQSQDSQSQAYTMNSGMDFSQRKQQEQYQEKAFKSGMIHSINAQQEESQGSSPVNRIGTYRYDSGRMNYAV